MQLPAPQIPDPVPLQQQLVDQFVYQKNLALERAGVDLYSRTPMRSEKALILYGDAMLKMAEIVKEWNADPGVTMEACFAYSRSKKHMDGPQLNMLGSRKYLLSAIAYHLELPKDAAEDLTSREAIIKRLAKEAALHNAMLRKYLESTTGGFNPDVLLDEDCALAMSMVTSVPALYRFLLCPLSRPLGRLLLPEILAEIRVNAKQRLWADHNRWTYRGMAAYYAVLKPPTI